MPSIERASAASYALCANRPLVQRASSPWPTHTTLRPVLSDPLVRTVSALARNPYRPVNSLGHPRGCRLAVAAGDVARHTGWCSERAIVAVTLRAGQLAADTQFLSSDWAAVFINGTFGWPAHAAANLPSGGPAYPLATPGVALGLKVNEQLGFRFAVTNGDPAGPGPGDPQERNRHGVNFRVNDGALVNAVAAYSWGSANMLPGSIKLGAWYHTGRFSDQRFAVDGFVGGPGRIRPSRRGHLGLAAPL